MRRRPCPASTDAGLGVGSSARSIAVLPNLRERWFSPQLLRPSAARWTVVDEMSKPSIDGVRLLLKVGDGVLETSWRARLAPVGPFQVPQCCDDHCQPCRSTRKPILLQFRTETARWAIRCGLHEGLGWSLVKALCARSAVLWAAVLRAALLGAAMRNSPIFNCLVGGRRRHRVWLLRIVLVVGRSARTVGCPQSRARPERAVCHRRRLSAGSSVRASRSRRT
jgi:hypothetical protein